MTGHSGSRDRFTTLPDFAWFARAGVDTLLDALADGDTEQA